MERDFVIIQKALKYNVKISAHLTWEQALFSFRFVNNIPAGMAKRKPLERMYENRSNWAWSQVTGHSNAF